MSDTPTDSPAEWTVTGGYDAQADVYRQMHCCYRYEAPLLYGGGPLDAPSLLPAGEVIHGPFAAHVKVVAR